MAELDADLLRRYFRGERFQAGAALEQRILAGLADGRRRPLGFVPGGLARRSRALVAVAIVAMLLAGAALPVAGGTGPIAPGARTMLATMGLSPVVNRIMSTQDRATAAGHTVSLVGVFSSSTGTDVVVDIAPAAPPGVDWLGEVRLIDASGVEARPMIGIVGRDGAWWRFAATPATRSWPAKVTLQMSGRFGASWTLQFDTATRGRLLPRPAGGQAGTVRVQFDAVVAEPGALAVDLTTWGATLSSFCPHMDRGMDHLKAGQAGSCMRGADDEAAGIGGLRVYDARGNAMTTIAPIYTSADGAMEARGELHHTSVWRLTGPGPYRIVLTTAVGSTLARTVTVAG